MNESQGRRRWCESKGEEGQTGGRRNGRGHGEDVGRTLGGEELREKGSDRQVRLHRHEESREGKKGRAFISEL